MSTLLTQTTIRILCQRPGFRRAGLIHPAQRDYAPGALSDDQLKALRAEPMLTVSELSTEDVVGLGAPVPERDLPPPDRTVMRVMGLLLPHVSEPVLVSVTTAVLKALDAGTSATEFRQALEAIFARYAAEASLADGIPSAEQPAVQAGGAAEPESDAGAPVSDSAATGQAVLTSETGKAPEEAAASTSDAAVAEKPKAKPAKAAPKPKV